MKKKSAAFIAVDIIYLCIMILPIIAGIVLKVLTKPLSEGISVSGAQIFFTIPMPLQNLPITESQTNILIVTLFILGLSLFMTHGIKEVPDTKRQLLAEWIVEKAEDMTIGNMGEFFKSFPPFIAAILALSAFSSLMGLVGLYTPTSDINIVGGWAILVFILITYYKSKCGPISYVKSFCDPVLLTPLNIISEVATPISMAFRHYGNILSGSVIAVLLASGLSGLSKIVLGWLPGALGEFPLLQIGIPAVLSLYFDLFSSILQAYIFAMLTMMYISGGFPADEYKLKQQKKLKNKSVKTEVK